MRGGENALVSLIRDTVDDERLYRMRFRASNTAGKFEPDADELEAELRDEAECIERTVGCVTVVARDESGRLGPADYYDVYLFAILPRHIDMELFDRVANEARHRVMTRCLDE